MIAYLVRAFFDACMIIICIAVLVGFVYVLWPAIILGCALVILFWAIARLGSLLGVTSLPLHLVTMIVI